LSILTKICVVVLAVLIPIACVAFINITTVGPNWRYAYQQEARRSEGLMMDASAEKNAHNKTIAERNEAISELNRIKQDKSVEIDKLAADLSAARASAAALQGNLAVLAAKVGGLEREAANFNQRNDLLAKQLEAVRNAGDDLNKELIRVSELLNQAEAEKARTSKLALTFQERIRDLEEENESLRRSGGTVAAGDTGSPAASVDERITGTVDIVRGSYASINVGSANGVMKDMKLIVYRGDTLVAFLRVDEVEVDQAAGLIVNRRLDPIPGDKITNRLLD